MKQNVVSFIKKLQSPEENQQRILHKNLRVILDATQYEEHKSVADYYVKHSISPRRISQYIEEISPSSLEKTHLLDCFFSTVFAYLPKEYTEGLYSIYINEPNGTINDFPIYATSFVRHMKESPTVLFDLLYQIDDSIRQDEGYLRTLNVIYTLLEREDIHTSFIQELSIVCLHKFIIMWGLDENYEYNTEHVYNPEETRLFPLFLKHPHVQKEVKDTIKHFLISAFQHNNNPEERLLLNMDIEKCKLADYVKAAPIR